MAVYVDYQNCYRCGREAFCDRNDPAHVGNLSPKRLAALLAGKGSGMFELTYVGVYSGIADSTRDPKTFAARRRQIAVWKAEGCTVYTRALQYLRDQPPREKGVDVKLAIDVVMMAVEQRYDVGIIASCDTDLNPAIDALLTLNESRRSPAVEVIAWKERSQNLGRNPEVACRWIGERDYRSIQDQADYNLARN